MTAVTVENNVVALNDTGFVSNSSGGTGECVPSGGGPGDCGEGIHLVSVTNSTVADNWISNNAGGILMTDEFGPTAYNTVAYNGSIDNYEDCGITLASHVSATDSSGFPNGNGGVFDNHIVNNLVQNDGTTGQGGGILLGGGALFSAVYGNTISGNIATGNGLAGIVIHQHAPGDLNDNVITRNWVSSDNVDGDYDFAVPDPATTGIFIASGLPPGSRWWAPRSPTTSSPTWRSASSRWAPRAPNSAGTSSTAWGTTSRSTEPNATDPAGQGSAGSPGGG